MLVMMCAEFVDLHSMDVLRRRNFLGTMLLWFGVNVDTRFTFNALINGFRHLSRSINVHFVEEHGNLRKRTWLFKSLGDRITDIPCKMRNRLCFYNVSCDPWA